MRNLKSNDAPADDLSKGSRRDRRALTSKKTDAAPDESRWVTGPTVRKRLNISAVTLWRWRQAGGFPIGKRINGRLYFLWDEVESWLDAQPNAA